MAKVLDAFWRALAYCLMPRVFLLSWLPVVVVGGLAGILAWLFWDPAVESARIMVTETPLLAPVSAWLNNLSHGGFRSVIGPLIVVALSVPVLIVLALLMVSVFMGRTVVMLVSRRRFEHLVQRPGGRWWNALWWSLGSTLVALAVLAISLPLWLIPPLALLLPPLIWGWLTFRVMAYDALSEHADSDERRELLRRHRVPLLVIGVVSGYLGAAPSLIWAFGVMALPMMPLLLPVFVWLYTLVFVLASLWFAHFCLAALDELRRERGERPISVTGASASSASSGNTPAIQAPAAPAALPSASRGSAAASSPPSSSAPTDLP